MSTRRAPAALVIVLLAACDGKSSITPVDAAAGEACEPTAAPGGGTTNWFAVKRVRLGITKKGSNPPLHDTNAWKDYGLDLDQRNTTADDSKNGTNTCKRVYGSPSGFLTDGNSGIDNNFGAHVMQVISQLESRTEEITNAAVTSGARGYLFRIDNYLSTNAARAPGTLYVAQGLAGGGAPKFDATDHWHIATVAGRPRGIAFANGYIASSYWVSSDLHGCRPPVDAPLPLFVGVFGELDFPLHAMLTTFRVANGGDGTIVGVLPSAPFAQAFAAAWPGSPTASTLQQIVTTLTQSSDLTLGDPQFNDPTRTCDSISFAIGFELAEAGEPAPDDVTYVPLGSDAFTDAGTDGAGADSADAAD